MRLRKVLGVLSTAVFYIFVLVSVSTVAGLLILRFFPGVVEYFIKNPAKLPNLLVLFAIALLWILWWVHILASVVHKQSIGMLLVGLRFPSQFYNIVVRYVLGLLADIVVLPVSLYYLLFKKSFLGEKLAHLTSIEVVKIKPLIWLLYVFFLIATAFLLYTVRQPYTLGAYLENTKTKDLLVSTLYKFKNSSLWKWWYSYIGLTTDYEACMYSIVKQNIGGITQFCPPHNKEFPIAYLSTVATDLVLIYIQQDNYQSLVQLLNLLIEQANKGTRPSIDYAKILGVLDYLKEKQELGAISKDQYAKIIDFAAQILEQAPTEEIDQAKELVKWFVYEQPKTALEILLYRVKNTTPTAWEYYYLGELFVRKGDWTSARKYFLKAVELDPSYKDKVKFYIAL